MNGEQEAVVYVNSEFVPSSQAVVSAFDRGFRWGDGVYEMTRTFGGQAFRLRHHLERLRWSLQYTRIDPGMSMDEMERVTLELVDRNLSLQDNADLGITHIVSRGLLRPHAEGHDRGHRGYLHRAPGFRHVRRVLPGRYPVGYPGDEAHPAPRACPLRPRYPTK